MLFCVAPPGIYRISGDKMDVNNRLNKGLIVKIIVTETSMV